MLIRNYFGTRVGTDEEFAKIIQKRIKLCNVVIVVGILMVILKLLIASEVFFKIHNWFFSGALTSGGTFTILGIIYKVQAKNLLKDKSRLKSLRLETQDERTLLITQKSLSAVGFIMLVLLYFGVIIAGFFSTAVALTLLGTMFFGSILYAFVHLYYSDKL